MSHDSLASWVTRYTGIKGHDLKYNLLSPNNKTWHELLKSKSCLFTVFYEGNDPEKNKYLREFGAVADAFHREKDVGIAEIDIQKFRSFFFDFKLRNLPKFQLNVHGEAITYEGEVQSKDMLTFVNEYCDKHRDISGALNNEAGVIHELDKHVIDFLKNPSEKFLNFKNKSPTAEIYRDVMKHVLEEGTDFLFMELMRLNEQMEDESLSSDQKIIKQNVLSVFLSAMSDNNL